MTSPVLDVINRFLSLGYNLRESCILTDRAMNLCYGTAKAILTGRES